MVRDGEAAYALAKLEVRMAAYVLSEPEKSTNYGAIVAAGCPATTDSPEFAARG